MFGRNCESEWRSVLGLAALGEASLILRDQSQAGEWYARAAETAQQVIAMTIIETKPHRNGWKVLEGPGVEPVSGEKLGRSIRGKAAALALAERTIAANPIEKDAVFGPMAAQMGEPDRAIAALEKLLSMPYAGLRDDVPAHSCGATARSNVLSTSE